MSLSRRRSANSPGKRIIAFPRKGTAYTACFYEAVDALGAPVIDGVWEGRWILKNMRAGDVAHFHWPWFYYKTSHNLVGCSISLLRFAALFFLMRAMGVRIAWTAHNLYPHEGGRRDPAHRFARWIITRFAQLVLVHGETSERIVAEEFGIPKDKLCPIPHGNFMDFYPRSVTRGQARARLGLDPSRFAFGFVGLCRPYKKLEDLIHCFSSLNADAALVIAGAFRSKTYLEIVSQKLDACAPGRVLFRPSFIANDELQLYMTAIDALVVPYAEILTSGSSILALSFGKPVIGPDLGSMRDFVPPFCGVLYDPKKSSGLKEAMTATLTKSFDAQRIEDYARTLSWTDAAASFLEALEMGTVRGHCTPTDSREEDRTQANSRATLRQLERNSRGL